MVLDFKSDYCYYNAMRCDGNCWTCLPYSTIKLIIILFFFFFSILHFYDDFHISLQKKKKKIFVFFLFLFFKSIFTEFLISFVSRVHIKCDKASHLKNWKHFNFQNIMFLMMYQVKSRNFMAFSFCISFCFAIQSFIYTAKIIQSQVGILNKKKVNEKKSIHTHTYTHCLCLCHQSTTYIYIE